MNKAAPGSGRPLRCAIYTRKSSEEGLQQEFNSLQAQREACEAFISNQRREGWSCLPQAYDDGGRSGGNLDRPALQYLLTEIRDTKPALFKPEEKRGLGTTPGSNGSPPAGGGQANPWVKETWNFTQQSVLENTKPELAKQLKAAAGVKD